MLHVSATRHRDFKELTKNTQTLLEPVPSGTGSGHMFVNEGIPRCTRPSAVALCLLTDSKDQGSQERAQTGAVNVAFLWLVRLLSSTYTPGS